MRFDSKKLTQIFLSQHIETFLKFIRTPERLISLKRIVVIYSKGQMYDSGCCLVWGLMSHQQLTLRSYGDGTSVSSRIR